MAARCPSLEEVLGDIPPEKLDQPCQDKHLCLVAREITNWPFLAPFLGIKAPEVEAIRGKWPFNIPAQNLELLRRWQDKRGRKATYGELCKSFLKAKETRLAERVSDFCIHGGSCEGENDDPEEVFYDALEYQPSPTPGPISMELFADYLRMTYGIQIPGFITFQWRPPPTRKVFNLTMIHSQETIRRRLPTEELTRLMLRGSVSKVMEGETSVQLQKLFNLDSARRKVILIEGAPGAGKSTLAWDVCQKWKTQELFHKEFKVVIYVQLRDPDVQSAISLADLLPTDSEETRRDVAARIKACYGKGVLFVLDGWDEYKPGLRKGSLFEKLICNPQDIRLHHSTLLITSRPIASGALQPYASSRVEIIGFSRSDVHRYFEEALGDSLKVQKLQDQLKERPVLEASCYLPLNAAIMAHLFIELNHILPTTLYGVFSAVISGCIHRHLKRQSGKEEEIPSLDELPSSVRGRFQRIHTLAYEGSVVNKVTFSSQDLSTYRLSAEQNVLDLMQVVQSFASHRSMLCHFLHLSIQELLTALHISELPSLEQVRIFKQMFNNPRFAAVFRFYAAVTKLKTDGIRDVVARIAQIGDKPFLKNLMHCLYEAQDVSLCCFVASQLNGELDLHGVTLSPLDCLSVGYFLSCVCLSTSEEFRVDLHQCYLDDDRIRLLVKGLSMCVYPDSTLKGHLALNLRRNRVQGGGVQCLSEVINMIRELTLSMNEIQEGKDGLQYLLQALRTNTSILLLQLDDCRLSINEDNGPLLVKMLKENRTLKELHLNSNRITDNELLTRLGEGLKRNKGLRTLTLKRLIRVTTEGWKQFVLCLKDNDLLTKLDLGYIGRELSSSVLCREVESINETRRLRRLEPLLVDPRIPLD